MNKTKCCATCHATFAGENASVGQCESKAKKSQIHPINSGVLLHFYARLRKPVKTLIREFLGIPLPAVPTATSGGPKLEAGFSQSTVFINEALVAPHIPTQANLLGQRLPLPLKLAPPRTEDLIEFFSVQPGFAHRLQIQGGTPSHSEPERHYPNPRSHVELKDETAIIECLIAVRRPNRPTSMHFVSDLLQREAADLPWKPIGAPYRTKIGIRNQSGVKPFRKRNHMSSAIPNPFAHTIVGAGQPRRIRFLNAIAVSPDINHKPTERAGTWFLEGQADARFDGKAARVSDQHGIERMMRDIPRMSRCRFNCRALFTQGLPHSPVLQQVSSRHRFADGRFPAARRQSPANTPHGLFPKRTSRVPGLSGLRSRHE